MESVFILILFAIFRILFKTRFFFRFSSILFRSSNSTTSFCRYHFRFFPRIFSTYFIYSQYLSICLSYGLIYFLRSCVAVEYNIIAYIQNIIMRIHPNCEILQTDKWNLFLSDSCDTHVDWQTFARQNGQKNLKKRKKLYEKSYFLSSARWPSHVLIVAEFRRRISKRVV